MSSAKQILDDASKLLTRHEIRVAVCGMQNSGKTVFLTALADHLLHHDPEKNQDDNRRFDLGDYVVDDDADISDIHLPEDPVANFDYQKYRASFGKNQWPEKTVGTSELVLDFTLVNQNRHIRGVGGLSKRRSVRLRFLDVPGERLADFLMDGRDYEEWSDALLGNGKHHRPYIDAYDIAKKLDGKQDGESAERVALDTYKETLREAKKAFNRFVTPSSFRIPLAGSDPSANSEEVCGFGDAEFAPLPRNIRMRFPTMAKRFSANYRKYRKTVVNPIVSWMRKADLALLLVDVFSCLNCGNEAYNGTKNEMKAALDAISRYSMIDFFKNGQPRVAGRKIRIVITKIDLSDKQGRANLLELARQMFGTKAKAVTGFPSSKDAFLSCAAVLTDKERLGGGQIKKPQYPGIPDKDEDKPGNGIPKSIPVDLDGWKGRFPLKNINPAWFNLRDDLPPKHVGLDAVASFILGIPPGNK